MAVKIDFINILNLRLKKKLKVIMIVADFQRCPFAK